MQMTSWIYWKWENEKKNKTTWDLIRKMVFWYQYRMLTYFEQGTFFISPRQLWNGVSVFKFSPEERPQLITSYDKQVVSGIYSTRNPSGLFSWLFCKSINGMHSLKSLVISNNYFCNSHSSCWLKQTCMQQTKKKQWCYKQLWNVIR